MIAFLGGEAGRSENVTQILEEAESGEVFIVTSSFTLVEVIKLKGRTPIMIEAQRQVTEFFEKDYFLFVDATRKISEAARSLIWQNPTLFPKDAVHLASALEFHKREPLNAVHSYDKHFLAFNGKSLITCPIEEPIPPQPVLPLKVERRRREPRRLLEFGD